MVKLVVFCGWREFDLSVILKIVFWRVFINGLRILNDMLLILYSVCVLIFIDFLWILLDIMIVILIGFFLVIDEFKVMFCLLNLVWLII